MARAETAQGVARPVRMADLLVWLWRLLASAQLAVALIGFLALAGLLAVLLPQIPTQIQDSPAAVRAWLEVRKDDFGPFTEPMHRLGLFNVVDAWWFLTALGLLVASICVYAVDRFFAAWRNVTRPRERLPDSFFERAANRVVLATPGEAPPGRLEAVLRRRRFAVRSIAEGEAVYLFADRYAWAQLGNFISHAAVVLFLAGGLISRLGGYSQDLLIAEGTTSPVFAVSHPDQMQLEVVDAVGTFDSSGAPTDYRSEIVLYQGGREVARGEATVNDPFTYNGYRFHQVGYLGGGAALRVRDAGTGNTRYQEVLAPQDLIPAPAIVVRDARGSVLIDDVIVPTDVIGEAHGTLISVPGSGREFWVGVAQDESKAWRLVVYGREGDDARFVIPAGGSREAGGLEWTFVETTGLPFTATPGIPGDNQLAEVILAETTDGIPYLTLLGPVDGRALTLYPGEPVRIGEYEYVFEGRREFSGIEVRRDPGANFIWAAAGLLILGLLMTFYVPRLRLWARVRPGETVIAAQAERSGVFRAEAKQLMRELGAAGAAEQQGGVDA